MAIFISMLLLVIAVPSIQGLAAEGQARRSYEAFDALVREAQVRSLTERRAYLIAWEKDAVVLRPRLPAGKDEAKGVASMSLDGGQGEEIEPQFPAALMKKPRKEWIFWPTGTCEPAVILGRSERGAWVATYNPLTTRATFEAK